MRAFTVGDPADPKTAIGPMVSQNQYERVQSYIRKGIMTDDPQAPGRIQILRGWA
jgi:acyl-CoA reductase-like NAD-dependent aldehyde dehydrogenase